MSPRRRGDLEARKDRVRHPSHIKHECRGFAIVKIPQPQALRARRRGVNLLANRSDESLHKTLPI